MTVATTSNPTPPSAAPGASAAAPMPETAKDTLISIIIAFALAFVFRGFVIEAFVIPTGSMGPTLMGAHMKFRSPESGYEWAVDPWEMGPAQDPSQYPSPQHNIRVNDPMSGESITARSVPLHAGDRILVLKYLYTVAEPSRWDVIVFKNPTQPDVNYIKRLIGLPGEQVALVDGDVFVRPAPGGKGGGAGANPQAPDPLAWEQPGWTIARKPLLSQRAVWQPIYDAVYAPVNVGATGATGAGADRSPFSPADAAGGAGWTIGGRSYHYDRTTRTELTFDQSKIRFTEPFRERWLLDDRYAYDQKNTTAYPARFPVSDLRLRAGIEPLGEGLRVGVRLEARRHEFDATIEGTTATLSMRPLVSGAGVRAEARVLATGAVPALHPGTVTNIEFWHVDQSIALYIDGKLAAKAEYDWSPADRIRFATGEALSELVTRQAGQAMNALADPRLYQQPTIRWTFEGAPFMLHRPAIDRDLSYQPTQYQRLGRPALATSPLSTLTLNADQFFACGDNSPASLDGRLWDTVDPWVAREFDPQAGIVPRDLLLGRAFFVYWPSLRYNAPVPVPDFGRMRFIW